MGLRSAGVLEPHTAHRIPWVDRVDTSWNVLKWVLVVLATGFVGYVGRFGAQWLIERARARRQGKRGDRAAVDSPAVATSTFHSAPKEALKAEKKRAKAEAKAVKKRVKEEG